jgi:hypothetical protein
MDMSEAYEQEVRAHCPQARIVYGTLARRACGRLSEWKRSGAPHRRAEFAYRDPRLRERRRPEAGSRSGAVDWWEGPARRDRSWCGGNERRLANRNPPASRRAHQSCCNFFGAAQRTELYPECSRFGALSRPGGQGPARPRSVSIPDTIC